ncbi:MAG: hypothetical protein ABSF29_05760 [Tepidisphaeraceae bacterium]|jgi:hypothetical protein
MTADATTAKPIPDGPIVARAGTYYRNTRYIMALILLIYGGWSIYDGFYSWPQWGITTHLDEKPKTPTDIMFNKVLGCVLPPGAVLLLVRCLYASRGEYRLENGVVTVPGFPPVPLERIEKVDRELWDRKGIAFVEYLLPPGSAGDPKKEKGEFVLDDFVYEREPVDAIFKAIEASLLKSHPAAPASETKVAEPMAKAPQPKPAAVAPRPAPKPAPMAAKPATAARPAAPAQAIPVAKPAAAPVKPAPVAKPAPTKPVAPGTPPPAGRPPQYPKTPPRPRL